MKVKQLIGVILLVFCFVAFQSIANASLAVRPASIKVNLSNKGKQIIPVKLTNQGDKLLIVKAYVNEAIKGKDGVWNFATPSKGLFDVRKFVSMPESTFTIAPHLSSDIQVVCTRPAFYTGKRQAVLVFEFDSTDVAVSSGNKGLQAAVDSAGRIGVLVQE